MNKGALIMTQQEGPERAPTTPMPRAPVPVLRLKWLLALVTFSWLLTGASAEDADRFDNATRTTMAKARACDDDAATAFAQLANENADTVARAAFEKCRYLWSEADKKYHESLPKFSKDEYAANPGLLNEVLRTEAEDKVETWKPGEIDRLLVVVMDARLKSGHPQ